MIVIVIVPDDGQKAVDKGRELEDNGIVNLVSADGLSKASCTYL